MPVRAALLLLTTTLLSCGARVPPGPPLPERRVAAADAVRALSESRFEEASRLAGEVLSRDRRNPFAGLVAAITRYKTTMHQLATDVFSIAAGAVRMGGINERYVRVALESAERELGRVDADLQPATAFADFSFELCVACLEVDWNRSGVVDGRDRRMMEVERDADLREIPQGDPRRRPTFRFDHGDILWARAFLSFQRAGLDLLLAWRWSDVDAAIRAFRAHGFTGSVVIGLEAPARVAEARRLILLGLELADQARRAYLEESDDDREWVPNPRQRSHPLPLPVDETLYRTWELVIGDLRRMARSEEGLSVAELSQLGGHQWQRPPGGYLDIGRMLDRPKAITLDFKEAIAFELRRRWNKDASPESLLRSVLGDYYRDAMKPSPLIQRLNRMKDEVQRGEESIERKLRYLLWLN